ncbi:hypothetical protein R4514_05095 [Acinetobacter baumannii]|nr:hypothetical protein [Acinetobacter baumannii]
MDNYKIKVKDEASADEARDLFKKLGYHPDNSSYEPYVEWVAVFEDGSGSFYSHNMNLNECVEITIAQLRDLVVLNRNDVNDANHRDDDGKALFITNDNVMYYWGGEGWLKSAYNGTNAYESYLKNRVKPINEPNMPNEEKDPALISGRDAWLANFDGIEVEYRRSTGSWFDFGEESWSSEDLKSGTYEFRLKPQTIKVELEIPAPYKAKIGGRDDASFVLNVGRHQYCYKTEEDYTKARDALEAVFDAAVRGTNS